MNSVSVTATAKMVAMGKRKFCRACAMALAAHEAGFPKAHFEYDSWCPDGLGGVKFTLPPEATKFIRDVDAGRAVELPQTFILPLGAPVKK